MLSFESRLASASQRLNAALARIEALSAREGLGPAADKDGGDPTRGEALLLNLERAAWAMIEMAQAWVFELRLGLARKETENFDLLQKHGWLELEGARRFKQLAEFRNLSSREPDRIDWHYLGGDLSGDLGLFRRWNGQALSWLDHPTRKPSP